MVNPIDVFRNFLGAIVTKITVSEFAVWIHWHPAKSTEIVEFWELLDSTGKSVDQAMAKKKRECYRLHLLLGAQLISVNNEEFFFVLQFDNTYKLRIRFSPEIIVTPLDGAIRGQATRGGG